MAKRGLSRKELEDLKKREETEAAASVCVYTIIHLPHMYSFILWFSKVFEEFVATFQEDSSKVSKVWVKAGTYDAGQKSMPILTMHFALSSIYYYSYYRRRHKR